MSAIALEHRKVLVLNKNWVAIGVANLQRAIQLLFSASDEPKAHIVNPTDYQRFTWEDWSKIKPADDEHFITAANGQKFKIPTVIVLTKYDKMPAQRVRFNRRGLYRRDNYQCQYCGCKPGTEELTIDHIIPRAQGGVTSWDNCVVACVQCNAQKGSRRPEEAFKNQSNWIGPSPMKLLSKPKKPKFSLFRGERDHLPIQDWCNFISELYWEVELKD